MSASKKKAGLLAFGLFLLVFDVFAQNPSNPSPNIPRRFHIINLSLPKTGTASMAGIFSGYRAGEEFQHKEAVDHILDWRQGLIDGPALDAFLLARDKASQLEFDSTSFLGMASERVIPLFPNDKFVLCVRDGRDWIVSFVGMLLEYYGPNPKKAPVSREWSTRYGKTMAPAFDLGAFADPARVGERVRSWLPDFAAFWGRTTLDNLKRMKELPKGRRLVLKTQDISQSLEKIAAFAGVPAASLKAEKSHRNKGAEVATIRDALGVEAVAAAVKPWQEKVDAALAEFGITPPATGNATPTSPTRLKK
jgi:hypothetical protein